MAETTKTYVVMATAIGVPIGTDPRTGIDVVQPYRKGDEVELTDEQAKRLLNLKPPAIVDPGDKSAAEAEAEEERARAEAEQTEQLTKKQQLQKRATELGIAFEEKTTIPQLESLIAEKEEELRSNGDQTGAGGPDPDAKS